MNPAPGKILFIAASGIGNTILATPMIQRARELWPQAQLDLLTSRKVFQAPLAHADIITNFFDLERSALSTLWHLRRECYDVSINCFPSNRWQYNVVAGTIGATQRITHSYFDGNHMAWLMNSKIPADESLHDVEQNLRSLNAIDANISGSVPPPVIFALRDEHKQRADEWLRSERLENRRLVGLHVARGKPADNHWLMNRRLGATNSPREEDLRRDIAAHSTDSAIIFFGDAEQETVIANFRKQLPEETQSRCHRYCGDLWTTAALIGKCHYFISGDTVLMHIASVFQIPQKAYFMSTNPRRTAPRNPKAELVAENSDA
ncbi:MAG TPA: glycosyltransferase family 9 protein, partial [Candidatus Baltobacteraceae bacterium]|nr:glycosyltransferase family 9 protein [Candidatus Baltobacteraceae bacterium]